MSIQVNGKNVEWSKGETVAFLLERMKCVFPLVTVKINDKSKSKKDVSKVSQRGHKR